MAGHSIASCLLEHTPRAGSPSAIPAGLGCSCGCSPRSGRPAQHFLCRTPHSASAAVRGISSTFASLTGRLAKISKIPAGLEFLLISDDTADKNLWLIFSSKECFSFEKTLLPSASRSDSCNMYFCSFQMPLYQIHHCPAPQLLLLLPPQPSAAWRHAARGVGCSFCSSLHTLQDLAYHNVPLYCWSMLPVGVAAEVSSWPNGQVLCSSCPALRLHGLLPSCKGSATGENCPWANPAVPAEHTLTWPWEQGRDQASRHIFLSLCKSNLLKWVTPNILKTQRDCQCVLHPRKTCFFHCFPLEMVGLGRC